MSEKVPGLNMYSLYLVTVFDAQGIVLAKKFSEGWTRREAYWSVKNSLPDHALFDAEWQCERPAP